MAEWNFTPPSRETAEAVMSAVSGSVAGTLITRAKSKAEILVVFAVGVIMAILFGPSIIAGLSKTPLSFITPPAVHAMLGITGFPIARRIRKFAESSKIGELPPVKEEEA